MEAVTLTRRIEASVEVIHEAITDVEPFMRAGGFDEVTVEGDTVTIANTLGFARIELTLELTDDPDAALAYRQQDGIFEEMLTRYTIDPDGDGAIVTATTEFTLGGVAGSVLDATLIKRQRKRELSAQFEYLESIVAGH